MVVDALASGQRMTLQQLEDAIMTRLNLPADARNERTVARREMRIALQSLETTDAVLIFIKDEQLYFWLAAPRTPSSRTNSNPTSPTRLNFDTTTAYPNSGPASPMGSRHDSGSSNSGFAPEGTAGLRQRQSRKSDTSGSNSSGEHPAAGETSNGSGHSNSPAAPRRRQLPGVPVARSNSLTVPGTENAEGLRQLPVPPSTAPAKNSDEVSRRAAAALDRLTGNYASARSSSQLARHSMDATQAAAATSASSQPANQRSAAAALERLVSAPPRSSSTAHRARATSADGKENQDAGEGESGCAVIM